MKTTSGILERCSRYLTVWRWLIVRNARAEPALLALAIICGIAGRLGALVGFALSVKAAAFILEPSMIFDFLIPYLPSDRRALLLLLIAIPGLAFCCGAVAQILYNSSVLRLRNIIAESLALQAAQLKLSRLTTEDLGDRQPVSQVVADMRLEHGKLVAIEAMVINLIVTGAVMLIAMVGGLLIDWFLMSVIGSIGMAFALTTAAFRHLQSRDTTKQQQEAKDIEQSKIKALGEGIGDLVDITQRRKVISLGLLNLIGTMSYIKSVDQQFNNVSSLILDMGQAVIVVAFLILLIGADASQMSRLIILILIFRFFISYLQTIAHLIIKLGSLYPFLVELWRLLKDFKEPQASTSTQTVDAAEFAVGNPSVEQRPFGDRQT